MVLRGENRIAYDHQRQVIRQLLYEPHSKSHVRPFVGVDGEGKGEGSEHRLWIMRCGDAQIAPKRPLGTAELLEFFCTQPRNTTPVGYHFNYDAACIVKDLPVERLTKLYYRDLRKRIVNGREFYWPVQWHGYELDLIPKKYFSVRRRGEKAWFTVSDVIGFFQASFVKAIENWGVGDPDELRLIAEGKARRGDMAMSEADELYNYIECKLLAEMMEKFRKVCQDVSIVPRKWQGAGYLASSMLESWKVPKTRTLEVEDAIWEAGLAAYYGGRCEATMFGEYGPCYEADINSAYPDALRSMPCLVHSRWRTLTAGVQMAELALLNVKWTPRSRGYNAIAPFPVRSEHKLVYPRSGSGWYWSVEVAEAERLGYTVEILEGYECIRLCDCNPFAGVTAVYDQRVGLGKDTRGYPLKLGPNSLYGKTAQRNPPGPWTNYLWAGLVTAITRAKLLRAKCITHGGTCIYAFATDAIYSRHPLTLDRGPGLGQWTETKLDGMFLIQPGVYVKEIHGSAIRGYKRRGFRAGQFADAIGHFRSVFGNGNRQPETVLSFDFFTGWRLALARGKPDTGGTWSELERRLRFDILSKRTSPVWRETGASRGWVTLPYASVDKVGGNVLEYELDPDEKILEWDDGDEFITLDEVMG